MIFGSRTQSVTRTIIGSGPKRRFFTSCTSSKCVPLNECSDCSGSSHEVPATWKVPRRDSALKVDAILSANVRATEIGISPPVILIVIASGSLKLLTPAFEGRNVDLDELCERRLGRGTSGRS